MFGQPPHLASQFSCVWSAPPSPCLVDVDGADDDVDNDDDGDDDGDGDGDGDDNMENDDNGRGGGGYLFEDDVGGGWWLFYGTKQNILSILSILS